MNMLSIFDRGIQKSAGAIKQQQDPDAQAHNNFVRLLSIATLMKVNILPLTWSPALETLGSGATAEIRQSPFNAQTTFAYKRFDHVNLDPNISEGEFQTRQYNAIIAEIVALSSPFIYDHPNVVNLEGICWEIINESLGVWPVLVFRAAESNNLRQFLSLTESADIKFDERLGICVEVLRALKAMHQCGIVHGDVKPENVLVSKDQDSNHGIKVTDFGYSCLGSSDDDLVRLPQSKPWQAPEYHSRWFPLQLAKKMDYYSFGLLCLWLLFSKEKLITPEFQTINVDLAFAGRDEEAERILEMLKKNGHLPTCVESLVSQEPSLSQDARCFLKAFLSTALHRDPARRVLDIDSFIEQFSSYDDTRDDLRIVDPKVVIPASIPDWHGRLHITEWLLDLESCDFRVFAHTTMQFIDAAENDQCKDCSSNAAFQTALCYSLGFGVRVDPEKRQYWLFQSGKSENDFEIAIKALRRVNATTTNLGLLVNLGFVSRLSEDYKHQGLLDRARMEYEAMVTSREAILGKMHHSSRRARLVLSSLLTQSKNFESAADIIKSELQFEEIADSPNTQNILQLKSELASIYKIAGRIEESELLNLEVLDGYSNESDASNANRLLVLYQLSANSLARGRNEEAAERARTATEQSMKFLGPDHFITLNAQSELALAYSRLGLIDKAIELGKLVSKTKERLFGPEEPDTLESKKFLGNMYFEQERWEEARDVLKSVMLTRERSVGKTATITLLDASNFASVLTRLGQIDEAIALHESIFSELKNRLGDKNESTIKVMGDLATTYQFQGALDKAEDLEIQVLDYRRTHPTFGQTKYLLTALQNLSDTLYNQKKWTTCADLSIEELNIRKSMSNSPDEPDKWRIMAVTKAARALVHTQQWDSAIKLFDQEISWRHNSKIGTHTDIMEARALSASVDIKLGRLKSARIRIADFLEESLQLQGARDSFATMIHDLAESCENEAWLAEAEQLYILELLTRIQVCPETREEMKEAAEAAVRVVEGQGQKVKLRVLEGRGEAFDFRFDPREVIHNARESEMQHHD